MPANIHCISIPFRPILVFINLIRQHYSSKIPVLYSWWIMPKHLLRAVPNTWTSVTLRYYSGVTPVKWKQQPFLPLPTSVTQWQNRLEESSFINMLIFSWVVSHHRCAIGCPCHNIYHKFTLVETASVGIDHSFCFLPSNLHCLFFAFSSDLDSTKHGRMREGYCTSSSVTTS